MYPDAAIYLLDDENMLKEPAAVLYGKAKVKTPPSRKIPISPYRQIKVRFVAIKSVESKKPITVIEIVSPANKRNPGYKSFQKKKTKLIKNGIHFIEIDFLRKGKRQIHFPSSSKSPYLVALTRSGEKETAFWEINLTQPLPIIPVPLLQPDGDVLLNLQECFDEVYRDAAYDLSINYKNDPPSPKIEKSDLNAALSIKKHS